MKPQTLNNRRCITRLWPDFTKSEKEATYATIGQFLKVKHSEFIKDPVQPDYQQVLFCKYHGIVSPLPMGHSWQIMDAKCPCTDNPAPSKSISLNSIHFAVVMKNEFISGCTPVGRMSDASKWQDADILPITTDPAKVSCGACRSKIQAAIKRLNN